MLGRVHGVDDRARGRRATADGDAGERGFAILRIAHEALHNAVRHARAEHVTVRLIATADEVTVEVADDGIGFEPASAEVRSRHLGLTSMEERARELGRPARDPLGAGRGHDGLARGARRWLRRSGCCWSTTTRSSARACARS